MTDHGVQSGYLAVAEEPRLHALALLLSEVSDGTPERRELLGWILSHCPEIQGSLRELERLRQLYGLEPSAASYWHALQLQTVIRLALGPHWDAAAILPGAASRYPESALTTASNAVFGFSISEVAPLEEILLALENSDSGAAESRRAALREHLQKCYENQEAEGDEESSEARK